ncbi:MAG TPA: carbon storage regulator [Gemmatimonadaceae bacterium]|nr:carbon storage regulator [Gemmatimonadaceae bacterium]
MLILGRRAGQAIIVGGNIRIVLLASDRGGARIGIDAPTHVGIQREEIVIQIAEENHRATADSSWVALLSPSTERNSA